IGKLQNLEVLNLKSNQLTGFIPEVIDLKAFRNKLNGTLPPELGLHSKLEAVEVSENQLSGQLPEHSKKKILLRVTFPYHNGSVRFHYP
ncbi:putative Poly(A) polymerase beta, partial [Fagus crenata]